ncbi:MAG: sugar transferase [Erysipelotrichaceae bacterium]
MINNVFRFQKSIEKLYNIGLVFIESLIYIFLVRIFFKEDIIFFFYGYVLLTFLYAFILNVFMKIYGGHQLSFSKFTDLIWSFSLALFITNIISYLQNSLIAVKLLNPLYMLYIVLIQIIIGTIIIYIQWKSIYKYFPPKETLLIYNSDYSNILNKLKINGDRNFNITTFIKQEDIEKNTNQLSQHEHVLLLDVSENYKEKIIKKCYEINKIVYIIPDITDVIINSASNFHLIDTPLLALNRLGPTQLEKIYKRLIDIIVSLIGILVFFPIIFVVGIFIKLEDKGPIFYNQTRL